MDGVRASPRYPPGDFSGLQAPLRAKGARPAPSLTAFLKKTTSPPGPAVEGLLRLETIT